MADIDNSPGARAVGYADEKEKIESGLHSSKSSETHDVEGLVVDQRLERIVLWKRDLLLVPILGLLYLVMFLDRTNIANARIEGLEAGLNMPSNGYNTALWIFYIPFVLAEIPSNLFLNMGILKPNWILGGQLFLLAILGMCQGLTRSYSGLLAIRFLMGTLESALPAGATYMLSSYYTKKEAAPRFAWFFNFALAGPLFSGLLAYAIENLDGTGGYEGWRWIFIIEGLMTLCFALLALALLPDFPHKAPAWFLKEEERNYLVAKLEASRGYEQVGSAVDSVPLWKVLIDWRIHLFTICFFCCDITASSVSAFSPTILTQLGWTASRAQLMTMPVWASGIVSTFTITFLSTYLNIRFPFVLGAICCQLVGWSIMRVYVPEAGVRYAALFFMSVGTFPQMPILMGWLSSNLRGRKYLAVGMAWQVSFGNAANLVSSNVFISNQAPRYPTGFTNGLVFTCLGFVFVCFTTLVMFTMNKKRDRRRASMTDAEKEADDEVNFKFRL
ncbi:MFS general substrate transporter [Thozetella sp. PMI_491]|nr:MFS general substrate transporter [Thozetella sp. PMI_491]